jgi:hypothetical protein
VNDGIIDGQVGYVKAIELEEPGAVGGVPAPGVGERLGEGNALPFRYPSGADLLRGVEPDTEGGDALAMGERAGQPALEDGLAVLPCETEDLGVELPIDLRVGRGIGAELEDAHVVRRGHVAEQSADIDRLHAEPLGDRVRRR